MMTTIDAPIACAAEAPPRRKEWPVHLTPGGVGNVELNQEKQEPLGDDTRVLEARRRVVFQGPIQVRVSMSTKRFPAQLKLVEAVAWIILS